jgi:hypothetical protein
MKTKTALLTSFSLRRVVAMLGLVLLLSSSPGSVVALGSSDPTQSDSVGVEGRISSPPPSSAATITTPSRGQVFNATPITVAGLCQTGLLVKVFANNVFVGAATCVSGSYSLKVDLFSGANDLVARVYDSLDQAGPDSAVVTVTFNDAQFAQFGTHVSLSSNYARRGANPGSQLDWPIILSGGNGPYAVSVDWGDGTDSTLATQEFAGEFVINHVYASAGVYNVVVKASDKNGATAYLQLVGVGNGDAKSSINNSNAAGPTVSSGNDFVQRYAWWLAIMALMLAFASFWLGTRHELNTIRQRLERSRNENNPSSGSTVG